jgi:hypothetical protein
VCDNLPAPERHLEECRKDIRLGPLPRRNDADHKRRFRTCGEDDLRKGEEAVGGATAIATADDECGFVCGVAIDVTVDDRIPA